MSPILALDFGGTKLSAELAAPRKQLSHQVPGWEHGALLGAVALAEAAPIDTRLAEPS